MSTPFEQLQMMTAMLEMPEPQIQALAVLFHHEATGGEPLRSEDSLALIKARLEDLPTGICSGALIQDLFKSTAAQFRGDLFRLASATCDSQAASLILDELRVNGLHAGLCARALLVESLESQAETGPRRGYNALVLAAALSAPSSALHTELLVATIVQLCAPLKDPSSHETLARAVEGASSAVKREFDRLIMACSDRRVRERLIPMLSFPALRRPARACLESCAAAIIDSACAHGGHRVSLNGRFSILCNSALGLQFRAGLKNMTSYGDRASSVLCDCLSHSGLSEMDLIDALALCTKSKSPILKWKSEVALLRLEPSSKRDEVLARISPIRGTLKYEDAKPPQAVDVLELFALELPTRSAWWLGARAQIILRDHPDAFYALLRRSLNGTSAEALLSLLQVIRRCRLAVPIERELIALAESEDARLSGVHRSELVRIFATTHSSRTAAYILRCIVDADARVQAAVFSVLSARDTQNLGGILMDPALLERIACTADRPVRRAALKALRFRSRSSFEALMNTLLGKNSDASPELFMDAALYSGRPVVSDVLRVLEHEFDDHLAESGAVTLRVMRAQRGPWRDYQAEQVAI